MSNEELIDFMKRNMCIDLSAEAGFLVVTLSVVDRERTAYTKEIIDSCSVAVDALLAAKAVTA